MLNELKHKARHTARVAGLLSGGLLLILVGCGFLTGAGFMVLAAAQGTLFALIIIGTIYFGLGLVLIGVALSRPRSHPAPKPKADFNALAAAFLNGLQAGAKAPRAG